MFVSRAAFIPVPKNIGNKYKYSVITSTNGLGLGDDDIRGKESSSGLVKRSSTFKKLSHQKTKGNLITSQYYGVTLSENLSMYIQT